MKTLIFGTMIPQIALYFATTPNPVGGDGGSAPPTTPGSAGGGAAPPPTTPGPTSINWETAPQQFREGYNKLKTDFDKLQGEYNPIKEQFEKLGVGVDQLGNIHGTYQEVTETLAGYGEQLGIAEDEIQEAIERHGVAKVLNHLANKAQEASQGRTQGDDGETNLEDRIQQALEQKFAPIEERENARLTDAANQRFEQIVHTQIVDVYKAEGVDPGAIPQEESFMLMNATSEILKYDNAALLALKQGKGQAQVQKAFNEAKTYLDRYFLSRAGRERTRAGGQGNRPGQQAPPQANGRKATLEEMAENPELINPKYKVGT